jgi:uncharacterized protein (TIGR02996 family)
MTALADLRAAILADLDSDEPRLVYADALQAAGDPQGELITVQCELARLGCRHTGFASNETDDPCPERDRVGEAMGDLDRDRIAPLRARERALLDQNRARWAEGVFRAHRFARGFVDHAAIPGLADVGAMFDHAPFVRSVELWAPTTLQLAEPRLAQLRHLGVNLDALTRSQFFDEVVDRIPHLRSLQISIDTPVLARVLMLQVTRRLEELAIFGHGLAGLDDVLSMAKISDLRIARGTRDHYVPEESSRVAALRLAACPAARAIETLVLNGCEMRDEIADIIRSPHFQNVRILRLYEDGTDWLDVTLPALAGSLPELRALNLSLCDLQGGLRRLLAGSFPRLRVFRAASCRIDDAGIHALAASPLLAQLRVLDLSVNLTSNETIANALLRSQYEPPLELLVLSPPVDPALVQRLRAKFPNLDVEAGR